MTSSPSSSRSCGCPDFALSRRRLLGTGLAAGGALASTQLFGDAFRQVAYGAEPGGNVVVVLSLRGGADGLSIVVPRGADHDRLASYRQGIVVPESRLLGDDPRFGLHPSFEALMPMWDAGSFGAVHAVGLQAPNRSHFNAMQEIEDAAPGSSTRSGWINRTIGLSAFDNTGPETGVALGNPLLPASLTGPTAALGAYEVRNFGIADLGAAPAVRRSSLSTMWASSRTPLGAGARVALASAEHFVPLVEGADTLVHYDAYPEGPLRGVLANTAALIRQDLGTSMVTIDYGDWDMHEGLGGSDGGWMQSHLWHLSQSLAAFFADLGAYASRVTLVTISEFGRRVEENGSGGVDHGYANAMLLLGAGVSGGAVHGDWPGLDPEDLLDGDLAMRTDYRRVLWEVVSKQFPAISGQRTSVFPGLAAAPAVGVMA